MRSTFSVARAHQTQLRLSKLITCEDDLPKKIRFVAGVDVAYTENTSIGAVAVLDYDSLEVTESQTASCVTRVPYIPTLLAFRETQPSLLSIRKLRVKPDVFLVDGQGLAHPYHCGFASHLGLVLGKPTIGVAKSKLFGEVEQANVGKDAAFLKQEDDVVGAAVTTKRGSKPVYVSVGHKVSLETAIETVRHCSLGNRIPEPIRRAHQVAVAEKRKSNID